MLRWRLLHFLILWSWMFRLRMCLRILCPSAHIVLMMSASASITISWWSAIFVCVTLFKAIRTSLKLCNKCFSFLSIFVEFWWPMPLGAKDTRSGDFSCTCVRRRKISSWFLVLLYRVSQIYSDSRCQLRGCSWRWCLFLLKIIWSLFRLLSHFQSAEYLCRFCLFTDELKHTVDVCWIVGLDFHPLFLKFVWDQFD